MFKKNLNYDSFADKYHIKLMLIMFSAFLSGTKVKFRFSGFIKKHDSYIIKILALSNVISC